MAKGKRHYSENLRRGPGIVIPPKNSSGHTTAEERQRVQEDIEKFLANGGEVKVIPTGISGYVHKTLQQQQRSKLNANE